MRAHQFYRKAWRLSALAILLHLFKEVDRLQLVYGIHMDVIRLNAMRAMR
jgi:hypothetical protein